MFGTFALRVLFKRIRYRDYCLYVSTDSCFKAFKPKDPIL